MKGNYSFNIRGILVNPHFVMKQYILIHLFRYQSLTISHLIFHIFECPGYGKHSKWVTNTRRFYILQFSDRYQEPTPATSYMNIIIMLHQDETKEACLLSRIS